MSIMMARRADKCILVVALVIALVGTCVPGPCDEPSQTAPTELTNKIDKLFAESNRLDSPGCAVGIVRDGKLIYNKGFGSANLEYRVPNTPQTVFEVASFSKAL